MIQAIARMVAYMAILGAVVLVPHAIAYALVPIPPVQGGLSIAECATEDSTNCVWNAATLGNGRGNSFIDIDGTAYYFSN